ncbi:flagellar filament capping protein FliD [Paraburkholderia jirisanensis]
MSTVSSSLPGSSAAADAQSLLQAAAQSIIAGSTGNTTLDTSSLVTALVNAKVAGQVDSIAKQTGIDTTQITTWGTLQGALSALQAALTTLSNGSTLNAFTATASGDGLTATPTAGSATTPGATAGSYQIGVRQIAAAQVLTSKAYGTTASLGTGTLTISVGGKSMQVGISSSQGTVAGIAAAINSASNNPGVTATVVNGADGAHLVLHSTNGGAANAISVAVNETDGGSTLSTLAVSTAAGVPPTVTDNGDGTSTLNSNGSTLAAGSSWTQSTAGQDAYLTIDGTPVTSPTNSDSTALTGVTLNLTAAAISDTPQTLTIAPDTTTQNTNITAFVNAYNTYVQALGTATAFDSTGATTGALLGDPTVNQLNNSLSSIIASSVGTGSSATGLAALGISLNADGTLTVDNNALTTALQSNQAGVEQVFNSTNGIGAQLNNVITAQLGDNGAVTTRVNALKDDLTGSGPNSVPTEQTALTAYKAQLTTMYTAQFTALNNLMAEMNNNAQYLTALFGGQNSQGALSANK